MPALLLHGSSWVGRRPWGLVSACFLKPGVGQRSAVAGCLEQLRMMRLSTDHEHLMDGVGSAVHAGMESCSVAMGIEFSELWAAGALCSHHSFARLGF